MTCPRCNSEHTRITILTETNLSEKSRIFHSIIWLLLFLLWFIVSLVLVSRTGTLLAAPIILFLFSPNKKKTINQTHYAAGVCQDCGNVWFPDNN